MRELSDRDGREGVRGALPFGQPEMDDSPSRCDRDPILQAARNGTITPAKREMLTQRLNR